MASEISARADFSFIRYAQCWEDADILLAALDVQPHHVCLSVASAGDNTLALVSRGPQRVIALDFSPAQLACLELRVAAFQVLSHGELLELVGTQPSGRRLALYHRCRSLLSAEARGFWDAHKGEIGHGIGGVGKFERYLRFFGRYLLPLVQSRRVREALLMPRTREERERFYSEEWDNWRWRAMFQLFFSPWVMGRLGRDPEFFDYVDTLGSSVAARLLERTRYALTVLDPTCNPYLQWIILGRYQPALPYWLRAENFDAIRTHLPCLEWRRSSIEDYARSAGADAIDRFNLSDIFEYMSPANYHAALEQLIDSSRAGARLAYWNMMAPRRRPQSLAGRLRPLNDLADQLYRQDKAFFYSAFVVEEVMAGYE
jgi:S-adenosylmethionine-diacylglycerol 3-amino-3-carboxypropyl transferase